MSIITKGSTVRLWFDGAWHDTVADRKIPGGLWYCKFAKPVGGCTGTIACKAAIRGEHG
jgi:hypothetical protein